MSFRFHQNTLKDKIDSGFEVVGKIFAWVVAMLLLAWVFHATYNHIALEGWVQIDYWGSLGITFLTTSMLERVGGRDASV